VGKTYSSFLRTELRAEFTQYYRLPQRLLCYRLCCRGLASLTMRDSLRIRKLGHGTDTTLSTISSADGHCQQRQVNEKWGKSRERASLSMILPFAQHEIQISTFPTLSLFSQLLLPVWANVKSIAKFARSRDFSHFSFTFLCWQWPSADEIVDIVCRIALSTV